VRLLDVFSSDRFSDFWGIVREVDPRLIDREATRPVRVLVCGAEGAGHRLLAAELSRGSKDDDAVDVFDMPADVPVALPSADAYVYVVRADQVDSATARLHVWQLTKRSGPVVCAVRQPPDVPAVPIEWAADRVGELLGLPADRVIPIQLDDRRAVQYDVVPRLFEQAPQLALPIGRRLPLARFGAATQLILDTSKVNAEFAAVSSIPGIIPVIGGIAASGADMLVLTKNQAMLLVKLATVYDRSTDNRWQLLSEITPVVGAAFLWRWAARTLVSLLPPPISIAPRVGIAFVGTFVVGRAAQYYYEQGRRPPPDLLESFAREAASRFDLLGPLLTDVRRRLPLL
jgi:hypothetical protein